MKCYFILNFTHIVSLGLSWDHNMSGSLVLPAFPRISGCQQTWVVKYVCMNYFISNISTMLFIIKTRLLCSTYLIHNLIDDRLHFVWSFNLIRKTGWVGFTVWRRVTIFRVRQLKNCQLYLIFAMNLIIKCIYWGILNLSE